MVEQQSEECRALALAKIEHAVQMLDFAQEEEACQPEEAISQAWAFYQQAEDALVEATRRVQELGAVQQRLFQARVKKKAGTSAAAASPGEHPER